MLMNSKTIHSEMMKNDTLGFDNESNKKTEPGCSSCDFSIRVPYLDLSNTAIWNRKHILSYFISGNNFENNR